MIRAVWAVARNDLAVWMKSPASIAGALLPALGMGLLVAMLTASVGQQPVALVIQGHGRFADRMTNIIKSDSDAYLLQEMEASAAEEALGNQQVAAIIVVPENFDAMVANGESIVDLYLNNVDIDLADDLRRSVTRSTAEFDAPQLGLLGEQNGPSQGILMTNPYHVAIAEHDLRKTNVSFLQYQVIPIIILIILCVGLLGTALMTARDFQRNTAKMMMLSPARDLALVLGRILGGTLMTLAAITPLVALGFVTRFIPFCSEESATSRWLKLLFSGPCGWVLSVPAPSHAIALVLLLLTVTLSAVGLGALVGIALRDEKIVTMLGLNGATLLFFLGGGFTTVAFLPRWIQSASHFLPTKYAIEGLRQALFYPDLIGVKEDLLVLTAFAFFLIIAATIFLTRAWRRA